MESVTLLVVYKKKDEELFEHIKSLVTSYDDEEDRVVGTRDGSVRVMKCDEDTWIHHVKAGRSMQKLADKILFVGDIKGINPAETDFERFGVKYGCDGKKITVSIDDDYEWARYEYDEFIEELKKYSDNESVSKDGFAGKELREEKKDIKKDIFVVAGGFLFPPLHIYGAGKKVMDMKNNSDDNRIIRKQMIIYGLSMLYYIDLERYMNS